MKNQGIRQIFKITEFRNGCVYKTKPIGYAWITFDYNPPNDGNLQFCSISTDLMKTIKTIRKVEDSVPDMDITTLAELTGNSK